MGVKEKDLCTPLVQILKYFKTRNEKNNPDYLLVLIWSFRKEVIQQEIDFLKKGKLVFHLPSFTL